MTVVDLSAFRIPALFVVAMLEYAQQQGVDIDRLLFLADIRLPLTHLRDHGMMFHEVQRLLNLLATEYKQLSLGFCTGNTLPVTALGPLGLLLLSAENINTALDMALHYWDLAGRVMHMDKIINGAMCELRFTVEVPMTGIVRRWALECCLTFMQRTHALQVQLPMDECEIWLDLPEPPHAAEMRKALGHVRFDAPISALRFPAAWLQRHPPLHNAAGQRDAIALCDAQLLRWNQPATMKTQVQRYLQLGHKVGYPSLQQVATLLSVSPRTLSRKLTAEGTHFAALIQEAFRRDAMSLLQENHLSIAEVAHKLGYVEPANFTRAFGLVVGVSPSKWREQHVESRQQPVKSS